MMGDSANDPNGCWSYVGRQGAQGGKDGQTVNFGSAGCFHIGTVVHEIMHAMGKYQLLDHPGRVTLKTEELFFFCFFLSSTIESREGRVILRLVS